MKTIKSILIISVCGIILSGCGNASSEKDKEKTSVDKKEATIELTAEQFKTAGIELGTIEQKNLESVVKASGYLSVPPQSKANVSTFIGAIVKNIFVLEGNFVKKGQLLASLEHPDFIKLQEEYLTEKNNFTFLEKEYLRQKELMEQNSGTGKIFQKSESEYNTSKAKIGGLESQLNMLSISANELAKGNITSTISLTSPIDGFIGKINVNIGSFAEPNKTLFEIIDNTKVHCDLFVYEKDIFKVKVGQKVNFVLTNLPEHQEEHKNKTIEGEIFGINKSFESETKALTVHAKIENENHELIPGMYVNALISVGEQKSSAVPIEAIVKSAGKEYIFVVVENHKPLEHEHSETEDKDTKEELGDIYTFKMVEVITGVSDLGYIEIKPVDELSANAKVVIKNPFFILSKAKGGEGGEE